MATDVDICSDAILELGGNPIANFTESRLAQTAGRLWTLERDKVLRLHPWSFLRTKALLTDLAATPAFDWAYAHVEPPESVRLWQVGRDDYPVEFELVGGAGSARLIQSNMKELAVIYSKNETDPANWPGWYVDLMQKAMAARSAYFVTNSRSAAIDRAEMFENELVRQKGIQAAEVPSPTLGGPSEFLAARY